MDAGSNMPKRRLQPIGRRSGINAMRVGNARGISPGFGVNLDKIHCLGDQASVESLFFLKENGAAPTGGHRIFRAWKPGATLSDVYMLVKTGPRGAKRPRVVSNRISRSRVDA